MIFKYMSPGESITHFHLGMSQFSSCVVRRKWGQDKDARERSRGEEFPQGHWTWVHHLAGERVQGLGTQAQTHSRLDSLQ